MWPGVSPTLMLASEGLGIGPYSSSNRAFTQFILNHSLLRQVGLCPALDSTYRYDWRWIQKTPL